MTRELDRYERAFHHMSIDEVLRNRRAIVGLSAAQMPSGEQADLAKAALEALGNGTEPTPTQLTALETIVRLMRPSLLSVDRTIEPIPEEAEFENWDEFRTRVRPSLYTIGRIDNVRGKGIGTGFLVSDRLLVTNRHVLDQLTGGIRRLERGQARVRFRHEYDTPTAEPVDIVKVVAVHDTLDLSLFEVDPVTFSNDRTLLKVADNNGEVGDEVAVVGYPQKDSRNPLFVPAIFGNRFGVKRVAPGEIVDLRPKEFLHDCSTLGGNSGSPVVSIKTGQIVGVHSSGFFLLRNSSILATELTPFVQANT